MKNILCHCVRMWRVLANPVTPIRALKFSDCTVFYKTQKVDKFAMKALIYKSCVLVCSLSLKELIFCCFDNILVFL